MEKRTHSHRPQHTHHRGGTMKPTTDTPKTKTSITGLERYLKNQSNETKDHIITWLLEASSEQTEQYKQTLKNIIEDTNKIYPLEFIETNEPYY